MKKSTDSVSDNAAVQKPALAVVDADSGETTMQEPIFVAVDAGSGNIAVRFERDGEFENYIIPSRVQQGHAHSMALDAVTAWQTKGYHGEDVTFSVVTGGDELVNTCDPRYQISPAHRVLVINALAQVGLGGRDIILGETLPVNQFYNDSGKIDQKRIQAKRESLMTPVENVSGQRKAPRILDVIVYPEAVPIYVSASVLADMSPNPALEGAKKILVVDIGRFTTNVVELDEHYQIVRWSTFEHGVHIQLNRVHALLQEHAEELGIAEAKEIHLESIDMFIRRGYIGSSLKSAEDRRIRIDSVVQQAAIEHSNIIREDIRNVRRSLDDLDVMVMGGGGSYTIGGKLDYLTDCTTDWGCPVYISEQPEYATVRGVYMALIGNKEQILANLREA
ncbi:plasmid segregation protein ParM domain-containing protein [Xenorhabdus sp. PB30.3]|uniref:plasmid segregation protein ParM domain-containing protein n=1 Tax=Xenorhabdus sp. PB30.3 TaxID=2788941 RepID=UPI001E4696B1|nr:plasmid segregation protein ParM domain-containing protein [Xenorhabdus sp. PB30.3]MCC8379111.1 hypothetical protein [Xenorhabdus sp. PB30.3]